MASSTELKHQPIIITGPTASGKTALAIRLARQFNGEIICADSRTVFRGMDVGTAKPTKQEQSLVKHWGIDLVNPGERFTVADFKLYATEKIKDIQKRNRQPIIVGGTGLYVDALVYNYTFRGEVDLELREKLNKLRIAELQNYCIKNNVKIPENSSNKRYLIRAIEGKNSNHNSYRNRTEHFIVVGIATNKSILRSRIVQRIEQLFANDVVNEAIFLSNEYGWNNEAMTGNVYPIIREYIESRFSFDQTKERCCHLDWQLAKRQMTRFRKNPYIMWASLGEAEHYLSDILAKEAST